MTDKTPPYEDMLASVTTASLSAQLVKRGFRTRSIPNIQSVNPTTKRLVGRAFTLRYIPMREDVATGPNMGKPDNPQRQAIETAPPGHVLIADTHGLDVSGTFGDILVARLQVRGVAGIVSDGPMRDVSEIKQMPLPVFARQNAAPPSYASMMAVDSQVPIGCGGVAVFPDDLIVADEDGVVVVPQDIADEVIVDAFQQDQLETYIRMRIDNGESIVGVYPASESVIAEYEEWKKNH